MSQVILRPVPSDIYDLSELEPQLIQKRQKNTAYMYLESRTCLLELTKEKMLLSSVTKQGDQPNILAQGIKRLAIVSAGVNWVTPNVNIRNNNIQFISSNTGNTIHSVFIQEGFYQNSGAMMTAIVTAMNTATGASGLTFSDTFVVLRPDTYNLNSVGGTYYILNTCNAIQKGKQCYNLPESQILSTSKVVGNVGLLYTQYIDFCSSKLTSYTKLPNKTNSQTTCVLFRLFLFSRTNGTQNPIPGYYYTPVDKLAGINYSFIDSLSLIDFTLYDQNGDILYVPTDGGGTGGQNGFNWDMQIIIEP